jgi:transcription antitermination factor NusG
LHEIKKQWLGKRSSLVKKNLEMSVANLNMSEAISQILVPTEEVAEIKQIKGIN